MGGSTQQQRQKRDDEQQPAPGASHRVAAEQQQAQRDQRRGFGCQTQDLGLPERSAGEQTRQRIQQADAGQQPSEALPDDASTDLQTALRLQTSAQQQ